MLHPLCLDACHFNLHAMPMHTNMSVVRLPLVFWGDTLTVWNVTRDLIFGTWPIACLSFSMAFGLGLEIFELILINETAISIINDLKWKKQVFSICWVIWGARGLIHKLGTRRASLAQIEVVSGLQMTEP